MAVYAMPYINYKLYITYTLSTEEAKLHSSSCLHDYNKICDNLRNHVMKLHCKNNAGDI